MAIDFDGALSRLRPGDGRARFSSHLLRLLAASAAPLIVLTVVASTWTAAGQRAQLLSEIRATSRALSIAVDRELEATVAALRALSLSEAVDRALAVGPGGSGDALAPLSAQAAGLVAQRPGALTAIVLTTTDGRRIVDTRRPAGSAPHAAAAPPRFAPPSALAAAAETGRARVTNLIPGDNAAEPLVGLLVPVRREGRTAGVLAAGVRTESLSELLRAQQPAGVAAVVDGDGVIIARSRDADRYVGTRATADVAAFAMSGATVLAGATRTADGLEAYGGFHRVASAPWALAYGVPSEVVDAPARRAALAVAGAGGSALALFGAIALWQARRMRTEMDALAEDARGIANGRPVPERDERVREIAEARAALRAGVAALADSEERFRLAVLGTGLATWELDAKTGRILWSGGLRQMLRLDEDERRRLTLARWLSRIHPEDRPEAEARWREARSARTLFRSVYRIAANGDAFRWLEVLGRPMGNGKTERWLGVILDVTERREAEARQLLLMNEVDHRSKNALATVQSILRLTRADDIAAYVRSVEGRIDALARAHELLARDRWRGAGLTELAAQELAAFREDGRATLEGPPVRLAAEAAQPVSMVLHELTTNAAKHGALSRPEGALTLGWRRNSEGGLDLLWRERGGPPVEGPPAGSGFGSKLVPVIVRSQLRGRIEFDWRREGLSCAIALPPSCLEADDAAAPAAGPPSAAAGDAGALEGRRVLLAEDEAMIAADLAAALSERGCRVLGPVARRSEAERLAGEGGVDAAVLDVNLLGETSLDLVDRLAAQGVPVVLATGYSRLPEDWRPPPGLVVLRKPVDPAELVAALARALAPREPD